MYNTEKYDWTDFEEISLDSDRLLFEIVYDDPNCRYYCAETAKYSGDAKKLKAPIKITMCEDSSQGPIKLSDAINEVAGFLPDGSVITGWEIRPCDENGRKEFRPNPFSDWMLNNTKEIAAKRTKDKKDNPNPNVIPLSKYRSKLEN